MDEGWGSWTTQELCDLRVLHGGSPSAFARWLGVDVRTVQRWSSGKTRPNGKVVIVRLNDLARGLIARKAVWLVDIQGRVLMKRRDALRFLAGGVVLPLPGIVPSVPRGVSDSQLDHIETTTTALAGAYDAAAPDGLMVPVMAHLEDASRLLPGVMFPKQRDRLLSLTGDLAVFVAYLALRSNRLGQMDAYLTLAESRASEAGDRTLLAEIFSAQGYLYSPTVNGGRWGDPQIAVKLLERASELAVEAPGPVRSRVAARLAEERATAKRADGSDEALDRARGALDDRRGRAMPEAGFLSTKGLYGYWHADRLHGFQGVCDVFLDRPERAVPTLQARLGSPQPPVLRAINLTDLGAALARQDPVEAAGHLIEAHKLNRDSGNALGYQRILGARERIDDRAADLPEVRELDAWLLVT
ncbi:MAG: helix-turn-helix domain-containing protein [Egibacteraceae bacterium]